MQTAARAHAEGLTNDGSSKILRQNTRCRCRANKVRRMHRSPVPLSSRCSANHRPARRWQRCGLPNIGPYKLPHRLSVLHQNLPLYRRILVVYLPSHETLRNLHDRFSDACRSQAPVDRRLLLACGPPCSCYSGSTKCQRDASLRTCFTAPTARPG